MKLLTVEDARARMTAPFAPGPAETVVLADAIGRVLAEPVTASRDQPPYDASAMDGWAVRSVDLAAGQPLRVLGESAAGHPYEGWLEAGGAVRVFTGAAVPTGADRVVIQEEAVREGDHVRFAAEGDTPHLRRQGGDFRAGQVLLEAGVRIDPWRLALAASSGRGTLAVAPRPRIALLSTGEEIVEAGSAATTHQIFESNGPALTARARAWGADPVRLKPARDDEAAIAEAVRSAPADLIVTIGGASVGDHDLVKPALARLGLDLLVASVAVRPGKPTWFGRLADGRHVLGLPGNPASALVCAELFLRPLLFTWQGADPTFPLRPVRLAAPLAATGPREHWMRARLTHALDGAAVAELFPDQDSSLVAVFAAADALVRRRAGAPAMEAGAVVEALGLERL